MTAPAYIHGKDLLELNTLVLNVRKDLSHGRLALSKDKLDTAISRLAAAIARTEEKREGAE